MSSWFVYMIHSESLNRIYTGVSTDPDRRLKEHNTSPKGAKATKAGRPWVLKYVQKMDSKEKALSREIALKRLKASEKRSLFHK